MNNLFDDDNDVLKELEKQRLIEAEVTKLTLLNKSDKYSGIRYILNEQNPKSFNSSNPHDSTYGLRLSSNCLFTETLAS